MTATVLLLESEPSLRKVVAASLKQTGLRIIEAEDAEDARSRLEEESPDLFVLELDHPAGEHGALIDAYRQRSDEGAVVLTTTERPKEGWRHRYRPEAIVYKPYDVRLLSRRIRRLIQGDKQMEGSTSGGATDDPNDR
ncbi:MAG: hypothetical protein WBR18_03790 [Anaerolineales bacterium]